MSDLTQAVEISGGVFALMMATQYGTRKFALHRIGLSVLAVAGFGYAYLRDAPLDGNSWIAYGVALALGTVCAAIAFVATQMWRSASTGVVMTRCGLGFVGIWAAVTLGRIGFVWAVSDDASFRSWFGEHMASAHLTPAAIAPFFLVWALSMVIGRVVALLVRAHRLPAADRSSDTTGAAVGPTPAVAA